MLHIAEALASQGRNGDTELVHMNRDEVAGLRALAKANGTDMSTNPHTGLNEAFNLGGILSTILPIAASFTGMGPLGSAALSAALTTATSGDLGQGLTAGLSSYALGGLGSKLLGAGAPAIGAGMPAAQVGAEAAQAGSQAAAAGVSPANYAINAGSNLAPVAQSAISSGAPNMGSAAAQRFNAFSNVGAAPMAQSGITGIAPQSGGVAMGQADPYASGFLDGKAPDNFYNAQQYAPNTSSNTGIGMLDKGIDWAKENPWKTAGIAGAGLLAANSLMGQKKPKDTPEDPIYDYTYGSSALTPEQMAYNSSHPSGEQYYMNPTPTLTNTGRRLNGYASGGKVEEPSLMGFASYLAHGKRLPSEVADDKEKERNTRTDLPSIKNYQLDVAAHKKQLDDAMNGYARGGAISSGIAGLNHSAMVQGPGDGMSDSVQANINGQEPVKLSNDEFIIPADVVSHLGNGSSKAGADQLHNMMGKVRKARTGKSKQSKQIDPAKYLPQ